MSTLSPELAPPPSAEIAEPATSPTRRRAMTAVARVVFLVAMIGVVAWSVRSGLALRRWTWDYTAGVHFFSDVNNGYYWGSQANLPVDRPIGFLNVYDNVARQAEESARKASRPDADDDYRLDYAPLRLYLMSRWVAWTRTVDPQQASIAARASAQGSRPNYWQTPYDFFAFTLRFNTALEVLAAVGIFLLSRHWMLRAGRLAQPPPTMLTRRARCLAWLDRPMSYRAILLPLIGSLLFWFNPAVLLSAHAWPTWDMWVIPFFVWAVYFASIDCWFIAGLVIAVGAMFKGQQLFVAPMFILWPLFAGQPGKGLRWAIGLVFGVAVLASPWLLSYVPGGVTAQSVPADRVIDYAAVLWIIGFAVVSIALPPLIRLLRSRLTDPVLRKQRLAVVAVPLLAAVLIAFWPFLQIDRRPYWLLGLLITAITIAGPLWLNLKRRLLLTAGVTGAAILLCATLFHGNLNWLYIGWGYGTRHYMYMTTGVSDNLAGLLHERFGWNSVDDVVTEFAAHPLRLWPTSVVVFSSVTVITIRQLLAAIYLVTFLLSVIGIAKQYRRNDPRFLIAITAPWIMFFTFLPQIHERYLIYAAGVGCCMAAVSLGMTLMNVLLSLLTTAMTLHVMLIHAQKNWFPTAFGNDVSPTFRASLLRAIAKSHPDAGWAVLLCAGVFLYLSLTSSRKPPVPLPPGEGKRRQSLRAGEGQPAPSFPSPRTDEGQPVPSFPSPHTDEAQTAPLPESAPDSSPLLPQSPDPC